MPTSRLPEFIRRLTALETKMNEHLEESGTIRTDIAWLTKAFWTLAGAGLTFNVTLAVGIILYLLKVR